MRGSVSAGPRPTLLIPAARVPPRKETSGLLPHLRGAWLDHEYWLPVRARLRACFACEFPSRVREPRRPDRQGERAGRRHFLPGHEAGSIPGCRLRASCAPVGTSAERF